MSEPICIGDVRFVESTLWLRRQLNHDPHSAIIDKGSIILIIANTNDHGQSFYFFIDQNGQLYYTLPSWIEGTTLLLSRDDAEVAKRLPPNYRV